jgi:hypothetical protein
MTGMHHHIQLFLVEMESCKVFSPGWPGTMILQISASQVARITGMNHGTYLLNFVFLGDRHSDWGEMESHCSFDMHYLRSKDVAEFFMCIGHLYFCKLFTEIATY